VREGAVRIPWLLSPAAFAHPHIVAKTVTEVTPVTLYQRVIYEIRGKGCGQLRNPVSGPGKMDEKTGAQTVKTR
jgi:hypothetical protein